MKKPSTTQRNVQKEIAQAVKARVIEMLQTTEQHYSEFQYSMGIEYLKAYLPGDEFGLDTIERSKIFWAWWINHWNNRDAVFNTDAMENLTVNLRRKVYQELHCGKTLAGTIRPHGAVLHNTYAKMITELVQTETENA